MRILITGITGYLGSKLTAALLDSGCIVIGLKRRSSSLRRIEHLLPQLKLHNAEDGDMLEILTMYGNIDAVVHTATCYGRNGESADQIVDANLLFPLKLMNLAATKGIKLFVNSDTVLDKLFNPYALSKWQFSQWGRYYAQKTNVCFLNLRLEHFYGPYDDQSKFITYIVRSCLSNTTEIRLTEGRQKRDLIYIDDVIAAYLLVIKKKLNCDESFVEYDVGSGSACTIRECVEVIHRLTASKTRLNFGAIPYREGEAMFSQANCIPLNELGWSCHFSLESGLKQVIEQERLDVGLK